MVTIVAFNDKFREELLNCEIIEILFEAKVLIVRWRKEQRFSHIVLYAMFSKQALTSSGSRTPQKLTRKE